MFFFSDYKKKTHTNNTTSTNSQKKRLFSVLDFPVKNNKYGKYYGHYPGQAAYKAFNKISTLINMSNKGYLDNLNPYQHQSNPLKFTATNRGRHINKKGPYEI